jgi:hypothetical protein
MKHIHHASVIPAASARLALAACVISPSGCMGSRGSTGTMRSMSDGASTSMAMTAQQVSVNP